MTQASSRSPRARLTRLSRDRWLVAYADMVTLVLACFAALYAGAVAHAPVVAPLAARVPPPPLAAPATPERAAPARDDLGDALARIVASDASMAAIDITTDARGLVISLPEAGSFAVGRADLSPDAERILSDLAGALSAVENPVRIEGHTDDQPIQSVAFPSNWELSTARATRVVQFFIERGGLDPVRLSAAGYGPYHPRVPNDSPVDRARNRRVDIVVITTAGDAGSPGAAGPS